MFDKSQINQQPVATFVCPGHPLLDAVISLIREQYEQIMRQGAILVDDTDPGDALSAIFLLEHAVQDGRITSAGKPHVISQRLQFASINKAGQAINAGIAPHLNLRPAKAEEIGAVRDLLEEDWLTSELEKTAIRFATVDLAQGHVAEVKARRLPEIEKLEQEVRARLKKEINYWDCAGLRAERGREGRQEDAAQLAKRATPRRGFGGASEAAAGSAPAGAFHLVAAAARARRHGGHSTRPSGRALRLAFRPISRRTPRRAEKSSLPRWERSWQRNVRWVTRRSTCPPKRLATISLRTTRRSGHLRFIEVKGRIDGADSVMITRQEVITSLHEPEKFILAIVSVPGGFAHEPRYVRGPLVEREPSFLETAIQFDLRRLIERAGAPA